MDNGFSILMLVFAIALLIYAGILSSGNPKDLPMRVQPSLRSTDKKGQVKRIARVVAIVALSPLIGGAAGIFAGNLCGLIVMAAVAVICIIAAVLSKRSRNNQK